MPSPINFSSAEYPSLSRLVQGQEVKIIMKAKVGIKTLTSSGEYITIHPEEISVEKGRKISMSELMLMKIAQQGDMQPIQIP